MSYYHKNTILFIDGEFKRQKDAPGNLYSQTMHYGYGAFEGMRSYSTDNGTRIFKAAEHFNRLKFSCEKVHIPFKWNINDLIEAAYKLLEVNKLKNAYIRPLVFCAPNMTLYKPVEAGLMMAVWEWDSYFGDKQLKTCISSYERPNPKSVPVDAKITGNYVNSILASQEAKEKGFDEALIFDLNGFLAEAPGANIFIEKDNQLHTPALGNILPGITRKTIIAIAKILDIEVVEKNITSQDIKKADGAFLTGTATEVIGIQSIDDYQFKTPFQDTFGAILKRAYKSLVLEKNNYEVII